MRLPPSALLVLVMIVGAGGVYLNGPGLLRDFQVRNKDFVPASELTVRRAECTTHWFIYTSCDIGYTAAPASNAQSLSYGFLGPLPRKEFRLMRAVDDRNLVVADIGLAHLFNRIAGFCAFIALSLVAAGIAWRRMAEA